MSGQIKSAMVLAAGLGTRMRASAGDPPKPLVDIAGQSLLARMLERLVQSEVQRIIVNVHHRADDIEQFLSHWEKQYHQVEVLISDERTERLETGGGVKKALPLLGDAPFYICNADILWHEDEKNLSKLAMAFDAKLMDACLMVTSPSAALGYDGRGDFEIDAQHRLSRGDGNASLIYAGVQIATPQAIDALPDGPVSLNVMFDRAIANHRLYGYRMSGTWMHVGTPEGRAEAEAYLKNLNCS